MSVKRIVLTVSCLCIAALLAWYVRRVFDDSVGSNLGVPAQPAKDPRITGGSPLGSVPVSDRSDGPAGLRAVSIREPAADSAAAGIRAAPLPPGVRPVNAEIDPATGVVRYTTEEPGSVQPPPMSAKPSDVPPSDIIVDPATGAVSHVQSSTAVLQSRTPTDVKLPDGNKAGSPQVIKRKEE
jgi:hypothetical protein